MPYQLGVRFSEGEKTRKSNDIHDLSMIFPLNQEKKRAFKNAFDFCRNRDGLVVLFVYSGKFS